MRISLLDALNSFLISPTFSAVRLSQGALAGRNLAPAIKVG